MGAGPAGRRETISKGGVKRKLKAGVAKVGSGLAKIDRGVQKHRTTIAMLAAGGPLAGARWAVGKTGAKALIKKGARTVNIRDLQSLRNIPDIDLIRAVKGWPSATGIPFQTPAKEAFRSAGLTGGPAKYPKPGAIRVMRGINPQDLIAPAIKKMKSPIVDAWAAARFGTGAAKQSGTALKATIGKPVPASSVSRGSKLKEYFTSSGAKARITKANDKRYGLRQRRPSL